MAARKSAKKSGSARSASSAKKARTTGKRKGPDAAAEGGETARSASATAERSGIRASAVNMGHIFALRPRATTSFPQQALHDAKLALADESYATIADAARAVADRALEITHDGARPGRGRSTPRF
jgi:hypothetical protein